MEEQRHQRKTAHGTGCDLNDSEKAATIFWACKQDERKSYPLHCFAWMSAWHSINWQTEKKMDRRNQG